MMTKLRLGKFVESYEPKYWYWEPIVILYKMMMVGGLSGKKFFKPTLDDIIFSF